MWLYICDHRVLEWKGHDSVTNFQGQAASWYFYLGKRAVPSADMMEGCGHSVRHSEAVVSHALMREARCDCSPKINLGRKRTAPRCRRQVPVPQAMCQFLGGALVATAQLITAAVLNSMGHEVTCLSHQLRPAVLMA